MPDITLTLDDADAAVVGDLRRAGGFASDEDLLKVACWLLGQRLGVEMPPDAFRVAYRREMKKLLTTKE